MGSSDTLLDTEVVVLYFQSHLPEARDQTRVLRSAGRRAPTD